MKPPVSVVIPLFNAEAFIAETLTSVAAQEYPVEQLEVIVVNDGSTDDGPRRAKEFLAGTKLDWKLWDIPNSGPSRARNEGWRLARGAWIQFLDADDTLHPHKLQLQMAATHELSDDVAVVFSDWEEALGSARNLYSPVLGPDVLDQLLSSGQHVHLGSMLCRRSWLEQVGGFDETRRHGEDVDLPLRMAMAGGQLRRVASPAPLFCYRRNAASVSFTKRRAFLQGSITNLEKLEKFWRERGALTPQRQRLLADGYFDSARGLTKCDWSAFLQLAHRIHALVPGFVPKGPPRLRQLSRLVGYTRAEWVAKQFRNCKAIVSAPRDAARFD